MCPFVSGMPRNKLDIPPFFRRLRRAMSSLLLLRFVWFHSTPVGAINWRTFLSINSGRNSKFCVIMTVEFNTQPRLRPKSITPRTSSGNISLIMFWTYSTCSTVSLRRNRWKQKKWSALLLVPKLHVEGVKLQDLHWSRETEPDFPTVCYTLLRRDNITYQF